MINAIQQYTFIIPSFIDMSHDIYHFISCLSLFYLFLNFFHIFQVFLGGSCNPTTWRTEIAIPMLKTFGITYYNPVSLSFNVNFYHIFHFNYFFINSKFLVGDQNQLTNVLLFQKAKILFFVIDAQTRGIVSMIETVSFNSDKLILVIQDFSKAGTSIRGEVISDE